MPLFRQSRSMSNRSFSHLRNETDLLCPGLLASPCLGHSGHLETHGAFSCVKTRRRDREHEDVRLGWCRRQQRLSGTTDQLMNKRPTQGLWRYGTAMRPLKRSRFRLALRGIIKSNDLTGWLVAILKRLDLRTDTLTSIGNLAST
jgi:hypothetical protein